MFTRAGESLGADWTLHDLRHSTAYQFRGRRAAARDQPGAAAPRPGHHPRPHITIKERAIARTALAGTEPGRYQPPDELLAFLESL
jgi:hypothetical protein